MQRERTKTVTTFHKLPDLSPRVSVSLAGMTATSHAVEPGLRHVIIHVDDKEKKLTLGNQLFQLEDPCGRCRHWCVRIAASVAAAAVPAVVAAVGWCCCCGCCCAVETCKTRFRVASLLLPSQFCLSLPFHLSLGSLRPSFHRGRVGPLVWLLARFCAVL